MVFGIISNNSGLVTTCLFIAPVFVLLFGVRNKISRILLWNRTYSSPGSLRVTIIGAGAIGTVTGLHLLPFVTSVTLVGRSSLRIALKRFRQVITLQTSSASDTQRSYRVGEQHGLHVLYEGDSSLRSHLLRDDVILVAVKTVATHQVGLYLATTLPKDSTITIVSLQNGIHNAQILRECLYPTHTHVTVLAAVVAFAAEWIPETCTFRRTVPGAIYVEQPAIASKSFDAVAQLVQALNKAQIRTLVRSNLQSTMKLKLLINATLNPLNAISGVPIPTMLADRGYRRLAARLFREGAQVLGFPPWIGTVVGMVENIPSWVFKAVFPATYKSSMLQDIERGRRTTEVEAFSGELVRRGEAPTHRTILSMVKELELNREFAASADEVLSKLPS